MASIPQLRLYKDESLTHQQLDKLNELYQLFKDDNPKWLSRQECLNLKSSENIIVAFNVFEGAAFEHLRKFNTRIVSVQCFLSSLKGQKKLPRSIIPVYSLSMANLNVCCTNIEKKLREEIYRKVEMMRGKTTGIFTEQVTHLVTTEVGSAKYHAAGSVKMPIMLPEWVFEVWKASENEDVSATDTQFLKFKCPIFHKYVICASGYSDAVKKELKTLIEASGGTYRGDLVCGTTTHLISDEAKGQKYDHAKMWKINIVKSSWVYDSIKANYCLPEKEYPLTDNQTSTPTESRIVHKSKNNLGDIDVSVIGGSGASLNNTKKVDISIDPLKKIINDTQNDRSRFAGLNGTINNTTIVNGFSATFQTNKFAAQVPAGPITTAIKPTNNYAEILKELNTIGKIKLTLFDGIGIYCESFDSLINEKLKKICNSGGATRFDEYNSDVTHVVVNQVNDKQCKLYIEQNPEVNIVKIDWLIGSCKENLLLDCKAYCVFKNALNSVKTPKKRARPEKLSTPVSNINNDLNDCLSQYANIDSDKMKPPPLFIEEKKQLKMRHLSNNDETLSPSCSTVKSNNFSNSNSSAKSSMPSSDSSEKNKYVPKNLIQGIFSSKRFRIWGFDESEVKDLETVLTAKGADLIVNDTGYVDYSLFPATIPEPITELNAVTVYWMRRCIEQNKILDLKDDIFYQPIPRYNPDKPLEDCVITISGFTNTEKDNIGNFAKLLGAYTQQSLSLKNVSNVRANTHLISKQMNGPKYTAAKSWNLPIVTPEWLIECCVTGIKADENKYFLDNKYSYIDLFEFVAKMRKNEENLTNSSYGQSTNPSSKIQNDKSNDSTLAEFLNSSKNNFNKIESDQDQEQPQHEAFEDPEPCNSNDLSLSFHNESKKPRLDNSTNKKSVDIDTSFNNERKSKENINLSKNLTSDDNDDDMVLAAIENSGSHKNKNKISSINNNKDNNNSFHTPTYYPQSVNALCNPRLKELKKFESLHTPNGNSLQENTNKTTRQSLCATSSSPVNQLVKTPLWLKPNDYKHGEPQYSLNIDMEGAMEFFKTPDANLSVNRKSKLLNRTGQETPLDELFTNAIHIAVENCKNPSYYNNLYESPAVVYNYETNEFLKDKLAQLRCNGDSNNIVSLARDLNDDMRDEPINDDRLAPTQPLKQQILKNVKVYVCKIFQKEQVEFYDLVEQLGGTFIWTYNSSCTHFIYSGDINDNNNELMIAKKDKKIIVAPSWLYDCQRQNSHVDENHHSIDANSTFQKRSINVYDDEDKIRTNDQNDETQVSSNYENTYDKEEAKNEIETEDQNEDQVNEEDSKMVDIPDSMAIKHNFLEQLSDKLASIKNNSINNKKWGKNNSGNIMTTTPVLSKHDQTNDNHSNNNNTDILSETDLLNSVDIYNLKRLENIHDKQLEDKKETAAENLNELNKSKSKWGISCGSDSTNKNENNSNTNKNDQNNDDTDEMNNCEINQKLLKRKAGNNFTRYKTANDKCDSNDSDELGQSKDKKNEENNNMPPASQIQVTYWKEDVSSSVQSKTNIRSSNNKGQKQVVNQKPDENQSSRHIRVPKDDITDRILIAAKAANSTKSYKS